MNKIIHTKAELLKLANNNILFNTDMVKAILAGRKTQTRRVIQLPTENMKIEGIGRSLTTNEIYAHFIDTKNISNETIKSKYNLGDILYIRETFMDCNCKECELCKNTDGVIYKADYLKDGSHPILYTCHEEEVRFRPSIHMPKKYARLFIKITKIKVEYLKDIDDDDISKEGFNNFETMSKGVWFKNIWDSTTKNKAYKWEAKPFVFVYEFEVLNYG